MTSRFYIFYGCPSSQRLRLCIRQCIYKYIDATKNIHLGYVMIFPVLDPTKVQLEQKLSLERTRCKKKQLQTTTRIKERKGIQISHHPKHI